MRGRHVLVAGAGLAGLAAARDLERRGARVTVVEARDRVGGRTWTLRDGFGGQHAEAGADLIEKEQEDVLSLARDLGLRPVRILRQGFGFYGPSPRGRIAKQRLDANAREMLRPFAAAIEDYNVSERRWDSAIARHLAGRSTAGLLAAAGAPEWVRARLRGLRGLFLADPEELAALAVVDFFAEVGTPGRDPMYRIAQGNDSLARALASALAAPPILQTILRRVRQTRRGVVVTVEGPSGTGEIQADVAIVAMPATTVREVTFEPDLPDSQQDAIRALRYGSATRLLLQFAGRFWKTVGQSSAFGTDGPLGAVWDGNEQQRGPAAILSLLAGGDASRELQALLRGGGAEAIVARLRWLGRPRALLTSQMVVWEDDRWARGGYAFFDVGFRPELRGWLARPAGRILFAGEHTSVRWQGYMNGAVQSGRRAAAEAAAILSR
jgi:monoamine oxidase